jgi:hypothetical protein
MSEPMKEHLRSERLVTEAELSELIVTIVKTSGPMERDELTRCVQWCCDARFDASLERLVSDGKITMRWPEGVTEPCFAPVTADE